MKILVTGAKGQLGTDILSELTQRKVDCRGADLLDFDVTDDGQTFLALQDYGATSVIHCAAYTAVDKAEEEAESCRRVNVDGTRSVALAAKKLGANVLYISTDYVFDGEGNAPYETDSKTLPLSIYGQSKLDAEQILQDVLPQSFILRTSWLYGLAGNNFVKTMLRLSHERKSVSVVSDQIGSPTYTKDLAKLVADMIVTEKYGIYHATNEGFCSWADFAKRIFSLSNAATTVEEISAADYAAAAKRPKNSRLSKASLDAGGFERLPDWDDALVRFLR